MWRASLWGGSWAGGEEGILGGLRWVLWGGAQRRRPWLRLKRFERFRKDSKREGGGDFIAFGKEGRGGCEDFGESCYICCSHNTVID